MLISGIINVNKQINVKNENTVEENNNDSENQQQEQRVEPIDFTLYDSYGNKHTLSDYKGKTIFLNRRDSE